MTVYKALSSLQKRPINPEFSDTSIPSVIYVNLQMLFFKRQKSKKSRGHIFFVLVTEFSFYLSRLVNTCSHALQKIKY